MFSYYLKRELIKGFGTYQVKDRNIIEAAIKNGYNFFDCAELYRNEDMVIDVIKSYPDKQIFVSTKLSYISIEKGQIEQSFNERLEKFKGLKINLLLLHKPSNDCRRDWLVLCDLYSKHRDKIDYIGVSNYDLQHLDQIKGLKLPFCNQFELNPFNVRMDLVNFCKTNGIIIISHTTLTRTIKFDSPLLTIFTNKYQTNAAKLLLRWAIQNGYITIPRTSCLDHLLENIEETTFNISSDDMNILNKDLNIGFFLTKVMF